jgi:coenzyme F420 hydrogenase subunit beta
MAIEELIATKGRFAVVGLPCHIHGIRKAEQIFEGLKEKIVLHIGLFCSHTVSQNGTDFILEKLGVKKEEITAFQYRGNSVPDTMVVKLKSGRKVSLKFNKGWNAFWNVFSPFFFTPNRCISCPDHFNELADISVGDAWLPEVTQEHRRESVIVTRTETAENMLASLRRSGSLSLRIVSPDKVIQSQAFSVNYKKQTLSGRLHFLNLVGKKTPNISPQPSHSSLFAYAGAFLTVLSLKISSSRSLTSLLVHVPLPLFRLYFGLFKIAFSLSGHGRC